MGAEAVCGMHNDGSSNGSARRLDDVHFALVGELLSWGPGLVAKAKGWASVSSASPSANPLYRLTSKKLDNSSDELVYGGIISIIRF